MVSDDKGKFEIWEIWLRYDVDEDGEEDDVVITYHRASKTILRAIYNPFFIGFRPFVAFTYNPSEFQFDGRGLVEMLEKSQLEVDAIHNQRRDRATLLNTPDFRGAGRDAVRQLQVRAGDGLYDQRDTGRGCEQTGLRRCVPVVFRRGGQGNQLYATGGGRGAWEPGAERERAARREGNDGAHSGNEQEAKERDRRLQGRPVGDRAADA
ncbi:MAG: hypothetical protein MZV70_03315 [Desulfobacterales bacterium]|nr:hypothetical protein [Desulfobacterales bacterium]